MTEAASQPARRPAGRRSRRGPLAVAGASLASFLAVWTLLGAQLQAGHDPALGGAVAAAAQQGDKPLVTRTSGGPAPSSATGSGTHATHHAIVTRTSGGGEDD